MAEQVTGLPEGFNPLPPMVSATCEECGSDLEVDGITFHFEVGSAARDIEDYDWEVIDGKLYCEECWFDNSSGGSA